MDAASTFVPETGTGMTRILGDCEQLGRVTGDRSSSALRRLETVIGEELAGRLVGALAGGRRSRGFPF
ncbi:MAG TPA: hypothetical protein VFO88_07190 [Gaiellaceae bacterium]|jgi:hypothetical protein|nr:hypothetical protein [Gaiellaceae bacterium]